MSDKASRLLRIYSRLRRGPVTIEVIKEWAKRSHIEVSERQLYRDLKEIEQSVNLEGEQVIVYDGEKNRKTWKVEFKDSKTNLPLFDIDTFYLLKHFAPLTLIAARKESLEKIEDLLYRQISQSSIQKNAMAISGAVKSSHFYDYPYEYKEHKLLEDCIWAIQNQRKLILNEILYDHSSLSASTLFPMHFLPLLILYRRGCIHLCGLIESSKKLVILALEQIFEYETTNEMFDASLWIECMEEQLNNRFGITENIDNNLYDVEIEFSELTGNFVKTHYWHHSQRFQQIANGNWLMKMHCGINRELVGWIFQWMSNAKVVKPLLLEKMVRDKLNDTLQLYISEKKLFSNNVFRSA
jgi:predicted DNA-binding transcriptional regulator YafY